jgi:hypothetical protein
VHDIESTHLPLMQHLENDLIKDLEFLG